MMASIAAKVEIVIVHSSSIPDWNGATIPSLQLVLLKSWPTVKMFKGYVGDSDGWQPELLGFGLGRQPANYKAWLWETTGTSFGVRAAKIYPYI
jgi:hypothetical protein